MTRVMAVVLVSMTVASLAVAADPQPKAQPQVMFTTVSPDERLSSDIIGLDVYNDANQDIGKIKDIAYSGGTVTAYILSVGGFFGVGDRYVAVAPAGLNIAYDATARKWHANMDTTADQLMSAPAFSYPSKT